MKIRYLLFIVAIFFRVDAALAAGPQYDLRVDGLACPFCAYGIEKKFTRTDGVDSVEIDLDQGLVVVKTTDGTTFSEAQLRSIVEDAGFSMKSMTENVH